MEGKIHGLELEDVHFHEIGALDTIVDIVGAALAFEYFQIQEVISSPLPVGRGWIQSGHGPLPLPAPATLALLQGAAVIPSDGEKELVTPTGAAILTHYARSLRASAGLDFKRSGLWPGADPPSGSSQCPAESGWGKNLPVRSNEKLIVLETNIDDMNPQWYDHLMEHLFEAGALDCLLIPCQMKKNRPAVLIQVLSKPETMAPLQDYPLE